MTESSDNINLCLLEASIRHISNVLFLITVYSNIISHLCITYSISIGNYPIFRHLVFLESFACYHCDKLVPVTVMFLVLRFSLSYFVTRVSCHKRDVDELCLLKSFRWLALVTTGICLFMHNFLLGTFWIGFEHLLLPQSTFASLLRTLFGLIWFPAPLEDLAILSAIICFHLYIMEVVRSWGNTLSGSANRARLPKHFEQSGIRLVSQFFRTSAIVTLVVCFVVLYLAVYKKDGYLETKYLGTFVYALMICGFFSKMNSWFAPAGVESK